MRIARTEIQKRQDTLTSTIECAIIKNRTTNKKVYEKIGMSKTAWFEKKKKGTFTFHDLLMIASVLNTSCHVSFGGDYI